MRAQRFPSRVYPLFLARARLYVVNRKPPFPEGGRPPVTASAVLLAGRRLSAFPAVYIDPQGDKGYYTKPYEQ